MTRPFYPLDISIVVPGLPFQGDTLDSASSLGGSETAGLCMARELAKIGHRVMMFSNCDRPGKYDGVIYKHVREWQSYLTMNPQDVAIIQRIPAGFAHRMPTKLNWLWVHDLALARSAAEFGGCLWNIDAVVAVSRWQADQYQTVHGKAPHLYWPSRNGIDVARIDAVPDQARRRNTIIYAARPERGLDVLIDHVFPKILEKMPDAILQVCGYDNTVPEMADFYSYLQRRAKDLGPRCEWLGALNKGLLYTHYKAAGLYAYPTPSPTAMAFREVSCISAMEAMACGLPFLSSKLGALEETVHPDAGVLLERDGKSLDEYAAAFSAEAVRIMQDDAAWTKMSEAGKVHARTLDWSAVAREWSDKMLDQIDARRGSPERLARHFLRRSDVIAATESIRDRDTPEAKDLRGMIYHDKRWGKLLRGQDAIREQYETIGAGHSDAYLTANQEPRFQFLVDWIKKHPKIKKVLDVGCAHGAYAIHLSNETGVEVVGVDIDRHSIDLARKWAGDPARCKHPEKVRFRTATALEATADKGSFDLILMFEILEHVPDPTALIDQYEPYARKDGGKVLITIPYGPWEYMSYHTYPNRCHIWEYDMHDVLDLFGKKANLIYQTMPYGISNDLVEAIGWRVVEYDVTDTPTGRIDMARKLWLQIPRETISVCMIAGSQGGVDPEETLHWSLKCLRHVADEVIIGDCGMSGEAKRIIQERARLDGYLYDIKIVQASDPKQAGFETPRNEVLQHATGDWILWIDTDEKIIGASHLNKYARWNCFDGYSIRQHHFACDASFPPDMPVRMFRRVGHDGRPRRWFGMIHEHPEAALNEGPGWVLVLSDVHIPHVGYLQEQIRRERFSRNLPLLEADKQKYPDRLLQKHFVMRDNMHMVGYRLGANGGRLEPDIQKMAEETVQLWREHFRGKPINLSNDPIDYYSQANQVLNRGFVVEWGFRTGKAGLNGNPEDRRLVRFADKKDMEIEISARFGRAVEPFESVWY